MASFLLTTHWQVPAPRARVWSALNAVESWPQWWPYVLRVQALAPGDAAGIGAVRRLTWSSALPYRLSFEMQVTRCEPERLLEGEARGELQGRGCWQLCEAGAATAVRYDWEVITNRRWMNLLAPLLAPAFRWNHGVVMAAGGAGLTRYLASPPR